MIPTLRTERLSLSAFTLDDAADVASLAGAREIEKKHHPVLFNVVEEMTIASGMGSMPRVFVVDDPSPNAFAVGRDPKKAAVAVTTGLLRILDRVEVTIGVEDRDRHVPVHDDAH